MLLKYRPPAPESSGVLEAAIATLGPAAGWAEAVDQPRGAKQEQGQEAGERGPREEPLDQPALRLVAPHEEPLGELAEGEHERADPSVVLDGDAEVGVEVHVGEEVGVGALLAEPALAVEAGGHGPVDLVQEAELVDAHDAEPHPEAEGGERDQELAEHRLAASPRRGHI